MSRTPAQKAFKTYLEEIARVSGHSYNRMANEIGVSASTINRYLTGKTKSLPHLSTVQKLYQRYRIAPPADLGFPSEELLAASEDAAVEVRDTERRELSPDQSVWEVRSSRLVLAGFLPGDKFILDKAARPQPGDYVLATIHRLEGNRADTVLRVYQPPFLINPAGPLEPGKSEYVDNERVRIMGVIIESWRKRRSAG